MTLIIILTALGALISIVGSVLFMVSTFRVSVVWGLVTLFVPFGALVFLCLHWAEGRKGFLISLAALPFLAGAAFLVIQQQNGELSAVMSDTLATIQKMKPGADASPSPSPTPAPTGVAAQYLSMLPALYQARELANQRKFAQLQTVYAELNNVRSTLDLRNPEAVRSFNQSIAQYTADLKAAQFEKQELEKRRPGS